MTCDTPIYDALARAYGWALPKPAQPPFKRLPKRDARGRFIRQS